MSAKYSLNSNYTNTQLNKKYLDVYQPVLTRDNLSDETRTIKIQNKYHRRPDLMAYDMLGSDALWWVLVHYNREKIKDPINDFVSGLEIVVPKRYRSPGSN
jgi:hypothetical protein